MVLDGVCIKLMHHSKTDYMRLSRNILFLVFMVFLFSCSKKQEKLTKQEALVMAKKIDSSITHKLPKFFDELFDETVFANRIRKATDNNKTKVLLSDIKKHLEKTAFGDKILQSIEDESGHYQLVKHYEKGDTQHLLYRLYSPEGINYHDFELCKRNGKPGIADVFIYLTGEDLSKTLSALLISFTDDMKNDDDKSVMIAQSVLKIRNMLMDNRFDKAEDYYQQLPPDVKNDRPVQLIYLQICKGISDERYLQALNDFQALFPDDPNIDLLMIDAYIMQKEYDRSIRAIDKLDGFINSDPFLDYYRAMISNMDNKPDTARRYLEQLYKNYPEFGDGVLELIANYIDAKMNDKANALIKKYEQNEDFNQENLKLYLLYTKPDFQKE